MRADGRSKRRGQAEGPTAPPEGRRKRRARRVREALRGGRQGSVRLHRRRGSPCQARLHAGSRAALPPGHRGIRQDRALQERHRGLQEDPPHLQGRPRHPPHAGRAVREGGAVRRRADPLSRVRRRLDPPPGPRGRARRDRAGDPALPGEYGSVREVHRDRDARGRAGTRRPRAAAPCRARQAERQARRGGADPGARLHVGSRPPQLVPRRTRQPAGAGRGGGRGRDDGGPSRRTRGLRSLLARARIRRAHAG